MKRTMAAAVLAVLLLAGCGDSGSTTLSTPNMAADFVKNVDTSAYQAVTLQSGTIYYGKLTRDGSVLALDDVYYLTGATTENPSGTLVKRGAEIHAPTGPMLLNPALVAQVDNVGSDSVIARGIERIAKDGSATTTTKKP